MFPSKPVRPQIVNELWIKTAIGTAAFLYLAATPR